MADTPSNTPQTVQPDDQGSGTTATGNTTPNTGSAASTGVYITPRPNILDSFATYTWSASLYVMTDQQFRAYSRAPHRNINSYLLLMQSGGAPANMGGVRSDAGTVDNLYEKPNGTHAGRNPYFTEDFILENISIRTLATPQRGHGGMEMRFEIIETENISLLDRLWKVVQNLNQSKGVKNLNFASTFYLMVMRFYGYDENGVPVQIKSGGAGVSDNLAVVEKYYPFQIKDIKFRVANRMVNYEIVGVPLGHNVGSSTALATIPSDIELTGQTVNDLLGGGVDYSIASADSADPTASTTASVDAAGNNIGMALQDESGAESTLKVNPETGQLYTPVTGAAPAKAPAAKSQVKGLRGGLMAVMNTVAAEYQKERKFKFRDTYTLRWADGAEEIRDARVVKAGSEINKSGTAMCAAPTQDTQTVSPDKQQMATTTRNYAITSGQSILQQIELIIRQSEYISNQAAVKIEETTNTVVRNPGHRGDQIKWFYIEVYAEPRDYDEARNDYAYNIIYTVRPYKVSDFYSPFFNIPPFPGVHKSYPYWFTGQNTAVLGYEADFSKNYFLQITSSTDSDLQKLQATAIRSMRDMVKLQAQAASGETRQGAEGRGNEVSASAADYLYSAASNGEVTMRIIGDPAWMAQGEYTGAAQAGQTAADPFLPDGTINFGAGHPLFEVVWQRPDYYDLNTGLQDPYSAQEAKNLGREPIQSVVYRAKECTSFFRGGSFEQELKGVFYQFPKPDKSNTVTAIAPETAQTSQTDTKVSGSTTSSDQAADARVTATAEQQLPEVTGPLPAPTVDNQPPSGTGTRVSDTVQPMLSQTPNALVEAAVAEQSFAAAPPLAGDSAYDNLNEGFPLGDAEQAALTDNIDARLRPSQYNQVMARET